MVSTRKKRQSSRRFLSQLDYFDQDMIIGNAGSERQENVVVNEGVNEQHFTVGSSDVSSIGNENAMNVKTLERCFNERIDREMSNFIDTVEDRIQNAILTAIDSIVAPKIELAIKSINSSSGRDVTSVSVNSERREHVRINASFEKASGNNNTLGVSNVNDETRHNIPDEVSQLWSQKHILTGNHTLITWSQDKQPKQIKSLSSLLDAFKHHATRHHTNIRTCQHKYHKITIYQWLNKHQETKTQTQTIPLTA